MTTEELQERARYLVTLEYAEAKGVMSWWYLSYADDNGFRGGVYIRGFGPISATMRAAIEGISPGGQVRMAGPLAEDHPDVHLPPPEYRERLLTLEELQGFAPMVKWGSGEEA